MTLPRSLPAFLARAARCLLLVLATGIALHAAAQQQEQDPPGRVAYLNSQQGALSMSPSGDDSWYDAIPNRPLTQGDRLWADRNARAELYVGATALRMGEQSQLTFDELSDQALRVTVPQGAVQLRVRDEVGDQRIELGTGNLTLMVRAPGDYRVLVDPANDSTQIMVAQGSATVYGENGQVQEIGNRQQAVFIGRELAPGGAPHALADDFERWLAARNQADDQSQSARYVSRDVPGYQQLDQYGQWQNEPEYGAVWYPSQVAAGWAPYSDGYWVTVAPWGLTWIDRAPWGFAPSHYGRWKRFGPRWGWVPGQRYERPVYAPALVGFVGGAPGAHVAVQGGRPAVGWFPLAPGDRWRPAYRTSERYVERANRTVIATREAPNYANRALPNAVTMVPAERFDRGASFSRRAAVAPPAAIQARQQPEWRPRFDQGQPRDPARAARELQDGQRRAMQEQQLRGQQQAQQQQQEQARRQAEQQQQEQARRQAEQQQQESMRRQAEQQQQLRRQAEQQQAQGQRQAQQQQQQQLQMQQEQMRRNADQQQAQRQAQQQQQEQARRQMEQQQAHAQRQAQQQQEQMRRQAEQQQAMAQRQAEHAARQQQQQQQQMQQQRQQQQQQAQGGQRQRGSGRDANDQQQQRP